MNGIIEYIRNIGGADAWIYQVFIVVFCVVCLNFVVAVLLSKLHRKLMVTKNPWDDALIHALGKPLNLLIWIIGLSFAADIAKQSTEAVIYTAIPPIRDVSIIATITWFLVRFITNVEHNIVDHYVAEGKEIDLTTADAITRLLRLSVIITAVLVAMQTLGFSVSGILAFGGVGGLALGFAAKDLLANFFGGLFIFLDRPFSKGDWIRSPDREIEGTVEQIGWRLTTIRTFDKRPLYVPNSVFTTIAIQNPSRMTNRRIHETIGLRYDDVGKLPDILRDVRNMLETHPEIDQKQTLMVNFNSFAASSLDFFIYTFTRTTEWAYYHEVKEDVLLRISKIIESHGAEIAYPTSTIHIPNGVQPGMQSATVSNTLNR